MKRILAATSLLLAAGISCLAQDFGTSFFMGNYVYDYKLNPGAPLEGKNLSFASIGLGNISVSAPTSLSYEKLAPSIDGQPYWFLDSRVPAQTFTDGLKNKNFLNPSVNMTVFSFGKKTDRDRFNVEVNLRSDNIFRVPKEALSTIKYGFMELEKAPEDRNGAHGCTEPVSLTSSNYLELAVCYGFKISEKVTFGARLKALVGIAGAEFNLNSMKVGANVNGELEVTAMGNARIAAPTRMTINTVEGEGGSRIYNFNRISYGAVGIAGYGAAVDLGVTVEAFKGFTAGLSVLDLGAMYWNYNLAGNIDLDRMVINKPEEAAVVYPATASPKLSMCNFNVHLFTKYKMPFYDKWNVGMVGTIQQYFQEVRIGTGITPINLVSLGLSAAYNSCGFDAGASLSINFPGMNIFAGLAMPLPIVVNKNMIPVKGGINNLTIGMTLAI